MQHQNHLEPTNVMSRASISFGETGQGFQLDEPKASDIKQIISIAQSLNVFTADELECLHEDISDFLQPDSDPDSMFTVRVDGKVAAFIHYGPLTITDRGMMLFWILVAPEMRSTGLAKRLLDHMEHEAKTSNSRIMFIETSDNDTFEPAKRFYLKNGYKLACVIADYYEAGHGKAVFSKIF